MKLLLDTNVLIDYFARRQPFFEDAIKLRIAEAFGDIELWACTQSYLDILHILRGAIPHDRLVEQLLASLDFIKLSTPNGTDLAACLQDPWPDVEDQMIARGAQRVQADYLVTRNGTDFARSKVPTREPSEILEELAAMGYTYDEVPLETSRANRGD